jgi:hypothetical protein
MEKSRERTGGESTRMQSDFDYSITEVTREIDRRKGEMSSLLATLSHPATRNARL